MTEGKEYKVVVMGAGGVGKSSITLQLVQNIFTEKYDPTIEDSYRKSLYEPSNPTTPYQLEILDTAGSEQFASMRDLYIRNGDGFLLVYSQVQPGTLKDVQAIYAQILRIKGNEAKAPVVLVGNKQDLVQPANGASGAGAVEQGKVMANKWNCPFVETSARDKRSVEKAFLALIQEIERKEQKRSSMNSQSQSQANQAANQQNKKKKKCSLI